MIHDALARSVAVERKDVDFDNDLVLHGANTRDADFGVNREVYAKGLMTLGGITAAACGAGVGPACMAFGAATVLYVLMITFIPISPGPDGGSAVKIAEGVTFHPWLLPSRDCDTRCQLNRMDLEENVWHHIGEITRNGTTHQLHHFGSGSIRGLRAAESKTQNSLRARQDQEDDSGFITDYYWLDPSEDAWASDEFSSDDASNVGVWIAEEANAGSWGKMCLTFDFYESDISAEEGVLTYGYNGVPFEFPDSSSLASDLGSCNADEIWEDGVDLLF